MKKKITLILLVLLCFFLNIFWSLLGILIAIFHMPYSIRYNLEYHAIIIRVKNTWILDMMPGYRHWRWITMWNVVVLNHREEYWDELHECIHVEQFMRYPGILPLLYQIETWKHWYRKNRFEDEAFTRAGNKHYPNGKTQ